LNLRIQHQLLFVTATIQHQGQSLHLEHVLIDTGSAATVFRVDRLLEIGIEYALTDELWRVRGVGGSEFVFTKKIDQLLVGDFSANNLLIEVGAMEYGFELDGILGLDFLMANRAVIDLESMTLRPA
jgi:hypothetical protein